MTTPSNKRGCPTCNGVEPKSCLRCRGEARLSDWSDELPPPVREDAMTTPTPRTAASIKARCEERALDARHSFGILYEYTEQLERDLAAATAENAKLKAENSKLRSALELVHFKQEPWQ